MAEGEDEPPKRGREWEVMEKQGGEHKEGENVNGKREKMGRRRGGWEMVKERRIRKRDGTKRREVNKSREWGEEEGGGGRGEREAQLLA